METSWYDDNNNNNNNNNNDNYYWDTSLFDQRSTAALFEFISILPSKRIYNGHLKMLERHLFKNK
jgi:hypothetical protein